MDKETTKLDWNLLLNKCGDIIFKTKPFLPKTSKRDKIFSEILLRDDFWSFSATEFPENLTTNMEIYPDWKIDSKYFGKSAQYKGVKTDICLQEILETKICKISNVCNVIMFGNRIDTGYLLTHRLLYLNFGLQMNCFINNNNLKRTFCSLMFKEAITNENLKFPRHDIFLEQVVFCGLNGFGDFLNIPWVERIMNWQLEEGCFKPNATFLGKRTSNLIEYGCSNHATGLGIAAMAIASHKFQVQNNPTGGNIFVQ